MRARTHRLSIVLGMIALFALSGCGGIATPEWAAEVEETRIAQVSTADYLTEIAPTATPIPATNTPTPIPATATFTPSPTLIPPTATTIPTVVPPTIEAAAPLASAAGGDPRTIALAAGDPVAGQAAFNLPHTMPDEVVWACSTCHSVTPDQLQLIGPGLWNVSVRGETRVEGQNALDYVHTSILAPQEYIVPIPEGSPGWAIAMPAGWDEALGEQEFNDIVAYLFTLRDE